MKIDWKISKDNKKAILNGGKIEVQIKKINNIEEAIEQKICDKFSSKCGFMKIETNNMYDCLIVKNEIQHIFNNMDIRVASQFFPKLWSKLGDIYEEK